MSRGIVESTLSLSLSAFLIFAVWVLNWSAGQLLVCIWMQTVALWLSVGLIALALAARAGGGWLLVAVPLVGFVLFVTGQFIQLFGMFAWGAWGQEHGIIVRLKSFDLYRGMVAWLARIPEVLPLWQAVTLVVAEVAFAVLMVRASIGNPLAAFSQLLEVFSRKVFVNHLAAMIGAVLAIAMSGSRALLLGILLLVAMLDVGALVRAIRGRPVARLQSRAGWPGD